MSKKWETPAGNIYVQDVWRHGEQIAHRIVLHQNRPDGSVRVIPLGVEIPFGRIDLAWEAASDWAQLYRVSSGGVFF
jgi:hypothetical protein